MIDGKRIHKSKVQYSILRDYENEKVKRQFHDAEKLEKDYSEEIDDFERAFAQRDYVDLLNHYNPNQLSLTRI